jgi:hypothetical protein
MPVRRREILRGLLGLGPALEVMASLTALAASPTESHAAGSGAEPAGFLSSSQRDTLAALAETLVAPGERAVTQLPSVDEARVVDFLDRLLPELPDEIQHKLPLLLWGLEHGARLLSFTGRPFTRLDGAERTAFLTGFAESRFELRRLAFRAVKNLVMLAYYQADASWPGIGYEGPWVGRTDPPQVAELGSFHPAVRRLV